jgi:hypothetical protein
VQTSPLSKDSAIASARIHSQPSARSASATLIRPTSAPRAAAVAQSREDCRTLTLASVAPNPGTWRGVRLSGFFQSASALSRLRVPQWQPDPASRT